MTIQNKLIRPAEAAKIAQRPKKVGRPKKFENMNEDERFEDLARRFNKALKAVDKNAKVEKECYEMLTDIQKNVIRETKKVISQTLFYYRDLRHPTIEDVVNLNRIDEDLRMHFQEDDE